jgi:hypothetical protein
MEKYDDKYMSVSHDGVTNVFFHLWKPSSETLTDDEFIKQLNIFKQLIINNKPKALCADMRQFLYIMPPEIQKLTGDDFFPAIIASGVKKYALTVSADIFAQVSVEQTIAEEKEQRFITRYFDDPEDAKKWCAE